MWKLIMSRMLSNYPIRTHFLMKAQEGEAQLFPDLKQIKTC